MRTLLLAAFLAITLLGCAGMTYVTRPIWVKPGETSDKNPQNDKDDRECNYDAKKVAATFSDPFMGRLRGEEIFDACMKSRGYVHLK